ncbi:hypothetical protein BSKO_10645 [Bryopsis sp. KO-2023]|nr:hypothetical protein BSKO_10645 [Bryopsis sp. KO-2023]
MMKLPLISFLSCLLALSNHVSALGHTSKPASFINGENSSKNEKPPFRDFIQMARWLVHNVDWGVVSTWSVHAQGIPFGAVEAISDGGTLNATGRVLLYLAKGQSRLTADIAANPAASITISEAQMEGHCSKMSAEWPLCAKLTIVGELLEVPGAEQETAKKLIFDRFPVMEEWSKSHSFIPYELQIQYMELIDFFGGAHVILPKDYFAIDATSWQS